MAEKGPKIINFTDGSHGFARSDGLYEGFLIDAKGKFIKNKTVKGKKTKKRIAIIEEKTIADSDGHFDDCRLKKNECSNASFVKSTDTKTSKSVFFSKSSPPQGIGLTSPTKKYVRFYNFYK